MSRLGFGLIASILCGNAFSWGGFEQGILTGIVGTVVVQKVIEPPRPPEPYHPRYLERPIYVEQPRTYVVCGDIPILDQYGNVVAYRRVSCYDR